jgi:hypothetical protein
MAKLRLHISTQPNKTSEVAEICWRNHPQLLIALGLRITGSTLGSQATEIVLFIVFAAPLITANFNFLTRRRCVLCAICAIGKLLRPRASHFSGCALFQFPAGGTRPCGPRVAPRQQRHYLQYDTHSPQSPRKSRLSDSFICHCNDSHSKRYLTFTESLVIIHVAI